MGDAHIPAIRGGGLCLLYTSICRDKWRLLPESESIYMQSTRLNWRNVAVAAVLALVFLTFVSMTTSPLFVTNGQDSMVFTLIGKGILDGLVPYRDILENKGPILYFIEAFAQILIRGRTGVFLLQIATHTVTVLCLYHWSMTALKKANIFLVAGAYYYYLFLCMQGGNLSEEYTNCLFALILLMSCRLNEEGTELRHRKRLYLLIGVCAGCVLMIRVTDAIPFAAFLYLFFLWERKRNDAKGMAQIILWGTLGVILPVALCIIWYASRGALGNLIYGYFHINFAIISPATYRNDPFFERTCLSVAALSVLAAALLWKERGKEALALPLWGVLFVLSIHFSKSLFGHYLITGNLLFVICVSVIVFRCPARIRTWGRFLAATAVLAALIVHAMPVYQTFMKSQYAYYCVSYGESPYTWPIKISDYAPLSEQSTVYAIGIKPGFYLYNDVYPAFYAPMPGYIKYDPQLKEQFERFMLESPPDILYVGSKKTANIEENFSEETVRIMQNEYTVVYAHPSGYTLMVHIDADKR